LAWGGLYWPLRQPHTFYLTIDDGPEPTALPILLSLLQRYGFRATFFWLGEKVLAHGERLDVALLLREGHQVALHGYRHVSPWQLSRRAWIEDVERGIRVLVERLGVRPQYYRPPYGRYRFMPRRWSLRGVLWDLMPPDYRLPAGWAEPAAQALKPGDIVVLHERPHPNWSEWEAFLSQAAQKGLQATPLP
jgi:peptidoglycan/xylan/chitin deacetylase (PgdA/CDA1 family)